MAEEPTSRSLVNAEVETERLARFQSLQAGQYWRALEGIAHEGIETGTVLLIQSIRCVDDKAHTVILRPHPGKIGKDTYLEVPDEKGRKRRTWFRYDEHRFLLDDFLRLFEFEPDHQRIRSEEVRQVQNKISALQAELLETQSNPILLAQVVEAGLREKPTKPSAAGSDARSDDEQHARPPEAKQTPGSVVALAGGTVAEAIGSGITVKAIAALRKAANREHQIATVKAQWIQGKTTEIATTIAALTPFYEEQAAAALALTEDVRSYVEKLLEGIESLDLYVGKGVEVHTIREGAPAAVEEPLTFVQRKLMMDEELAIWADIDEWFDFEKEGLFFDALRDHDDLVRQIFPTERCVLVMATTRRYIDYGDAWANNQRNDENRRVFLLVRNGMNIHRVFSGVESHLGTARLFPSKGDHDAIFRGLDGSQIRFEDVAYTDRLKSHEEHALHYKRFLLLACGLDHRLKLFGDFYEGPPSLTFVSLDFQARYCRFLHDDEGGALPGEQRTSLHEWVKEKNTYLRSGSRVLCNWDEMMNPDTAPGTCKEYNNSGTRGFDVRYKPEERLGVVVAYRDGKSTCVDVAVSGYSYSSHADRSFNCKVNLTNYGGSRWSEHREVSYLCLDAVRPEELDWYIRQREARRDHIFYIRFFKYALKHIKHELAGEADTRLRMTQALLDGQVASSDECADIVQQAAIAWRAANRGKTLPSFDGQKPPAGWKALLDQMYMLAGEGKRRTGEVEAFSRERGYEPLRLVLSGGAKLVLYSAPRPEERDDRFEPHAWVHRITVERGKTKYTEKARRWALLPRQAASETTVHEWEGAPEWAERKTAFPSFERKGQVLDGARHFADRLRPLTGAMNEEDHTRWFKDWKALRERTLSKAKYVTNPAFAVPIGIVYYATTGEMHYVCVGTTQPHALLYRLAPNEAAATAVKASFVQPFKDKHAGKRDFDSALGRDHVWGLLQAPLSLADTRVSAFVHRSHGVAVEHLSGKVHHDPLLSTWLSQWMEGEKRYARIWLADGILSDEGGCTLDQLLGIRRPDDYAPVHVIEFTLQTEKGIALPKYNKWFDVVPKDEADDEMSAWPHGVRVGKHGKLVESVAPAWKGGHSSQTHVIESPMEAREFIAQRTSERQDGCCRAMPAAEIPDAPQPPAGVERWFVVPVAAP